MNICKKPGWSNAGLSKAELSNAKDSMTGKEA